MSSKPISCAIILKEDGYVLPYILLIGILIVSILFSFIAVVFFNNMIEIRKLNRKKLELACYSAVQKHIAETELLTKGFEIIDIDSISVLLEHRLNGFFYEVSAKAKKGRDSAQVKCLLANTTLPPFDNAVIISRPNLRATVAGNTIIAGNILSTSDRITRGNIFGIRPASGEYLDGEIVPSADIKTKLYLDTLFKLIKSEKYSLGAGRIRNINENITIDENNILSLDSVDALFIEGDLIIKGNLYKQKKFVSKKIFVAGKTVFESKVFSNIPLEIYSDSTITIEENANLADLTLFASGEIQVSSSSKLKTVQLLSEGGIELNYCELFYPSLAGLYVNTGDPGSLENTIKINSSTVNGTVFLVSSTAGLGNNRSKIKIDNSSVINGLVYSENNVEVESPVTGMIYTYNFWYYKEPTEYINWLVNLKVDRKEFSNYYLLPVGFMKENKLKVLKESWVY